MMRLTPTHAEATLWIALRRRALSGWKFRRQHVIAGYVVDFYCAELALAVEVDGPVHDAHCHADMERDAHLAGEGLRVLRVRNDDVLSNPQQVIRMLHEVCASLAARRYAGSRRRRARRSRGPSDREDR